MEPEASDNLLALPSALLAEINAVAEEEDRPVADVLRDAVSRYARARRWQKIYAYGEARAQEVGLTQDDVPRLIAEARAEAHQGVE